MIKVVMNRHSANVEKVEFINDESFDGKFPSPNVNKNVLSKWLIKIVVLTIIAETIQMFLIGYDLVSMILCGSVVVICGILMYMENELHKYDIRCNNEYFTSSDVVWFYMKLHFVYAYVGLTNDELTVIMPTSYNDEKLFKYVSRHIAEFGHGNVYCNNEVVDLGEFFNKSVAECRDNFKYFDNFLCLKDYIDQMVDEIVKRCKPLCYIVKEEK